jgi:hypothetical protein
MLDESEAASRAASNVSLGGKVSPWTHGQARRNSSGSLNGLRTPLFGAFAIEAEPGRRLCGWRGRRRKGRNTGRMWIRRRRCTWVDSRVAAVVGEGADGRRHCLGYRRGRCRVQCSVLDLCGSTYEEGRVYLLFFGRAGAGGIRFRFCSPFSVSLPC